MKMVEVLIVIFLFVSYSLMIEMTFSQVQIFLEWQPRQTEALHVADLELKNGIEGVSSTSTLFDVYNVQTSILDNDNFSKRIESKVDFLINGINHEVSLSKIVTDTNESEGQSSCRPNQNTDVWIKPKLQLFDLSSLDADIHPTDIDVVGKYAYISSNNSNVASSDFYIFDISDHENVKLLSKLNTGPGVAVLTVAGKYAYLANKSIKSQLQIIDISNKKEPFLVSSYKLPGTYNDGTTIGNAIFYKSENIFLGTEKSQISELHNIDVSDPLNPNEIGSTEIGNGVNAIFAFKNKLYIASPNVNELQTFTIEQDGSLGPLSSYNDIGSTGHGKSLSLFLNHLIVGKTQTFKREELLVLDLNEDTPPSLLYSLQIGDSVQDVLTYGKLIFTLVHRSIDGFLIFDETEKINELMNFPSAPLSMDCDKETFSIIFENSQFIGFINPSI